MADSVTLRIATINVRNTADRWPERRPLLLSQLRELRADVVALQELRRPSRQSRQVLGSLNAERDDDERPYELRHAWKTGWWRLWEGIGVATRLPVLATERLDLGGGNRVAQRVLLQLPNRTRVEVYNAHLHHDEAGGLRLQQVERLLDWMDQRSHLPQVLAGDLNARPHEASIELLAARLRSAHVAVHGSEPAATVPAPVSRTWSVEPPSTIDYIFVNPRIDVIDAGIAFDRVHPDDARLSASDHYGVVADIRVLPSR
jgi:endonuclease/exonuclease/phosphatase family metal-dependent hydrolase